MATVINFPAERCRSNGIVKRGVKRGVWVAPWLSAAGHPILVAVTSRGRQCGELVTLQPGLVLEIEGESLWRLLEAADPIGAA